MINTPATKVFVRKKYLTQVETEDLVEAYLMAVDCRPSDRIRFTVLLSSGGVWSGLPIEALLCDRFGARFTTTPEIYPTETLQPYTCLEGPYNIVEYSLLKNAKLDFGAKGNYLFTINYEGAGLAEDPEQYKTHNIIVGELGHLYAFPNNYFRVINNWFGSDVEEIKEYRRDSKFYFAGE